MDILIIIALSIAGITLFLVEVFIIPGISIAGLSAIACFIYAIYYAFANMGTTAGFITLGTTAVACILALIWFMKSKTLDKLALKKDITSKVDNKAERSVKVGDKGITTTRLALIGNANINEHMVEVKSMDGLMDEKTAIIVERIDEGTIIVRKQQ